VPDFVLDRITSVPTHVAPSSIPWPAGLAPEAIATSGASDAPLPTADVLVMTYTDAEGMALADVLAPGQPIGNWRPYARDWNTYEAQLTSRSPARSARCLAHYMLTKIGGARVLLVKSELHLATDSVSAPIVALWAQMITEVSPRLIISTGTGGGIGTETQLGDVFVVTNAKFNCTKAFRLKSWAQQRFTGTRIGAGAHASDFAALVAPNAGKLRPVATRDPQLTFGGDVETVDSFAFANSDDSFGVIRNDPLAHTEEMDDATLALALSQMDSTALWCSIRNASDPQVPASIGDLDQQKRWAEDIYTTYGYWTTIGSAIACWAVIADLNATEATMAAQYKLGKSPRVVDDRTLRFSRYVTSALPTPPQQVNYGQKVTNWPMYSNSTYGDCTCAAAGHMIQNWTATASTLVTPPEQTVIKFYEHFVGAPPPPDAGCNMLQVLKYWRKAGLDQHKILAFASLEPKNHTEAMDALYLFGSLYIGVELPDFAVQGDMLAVPWVVPPQGPVGDAAPNPNNGHCIPAVAYDARNLYIVTWGAIKAMSWQFYDAYADEAFAVLAEDFIAANGDNVAGFNLTQLKDDLEQI
jgi:nucleoside phosphorylase